MEHFNLIQKYLNNQLGEEEISAFNTKLKTDPEFEKEVENYKKLNDGFRALKAENFENQLKEWATETETNSTSSSNENLGIKSSKNTLLRTLILASAAVILLLAVWKFVFPQKKSIPNYITELSLTVEPDILTLQENISKIERGYNDNATPPPSAPAVLQLDKNVKAYLTKNFQQCSYNSSQTPPSSLNHYIQAYCSFKNNDFKNAATAFQLLHNSDNLDQDLDENEIGWLAILATAKLYDNNIATKEKEELTTMIDNFIKKANPSFPEYIDKAKEFRTLLNN